MVETGGLLEVFRFGTRFRVGFVRLRAGRLGGFRPGITSYAHVPFPSRGTVRSRVETLRFVPDPDILTGTVG